MKRTGVNTFNESDLLRQTLEATYEGLQVFDSNWTYLYVNQAAAQHGEASREGLMGKTLLECYPGIEDTQVFKRMQHVLIERKPDSFENYFEYADGSGCWFELFVEPHPKGILVRSVDITQRKDLESRYYQSQKMETIGQLAGGIAHDFNNKLGIILMYCELALEQKEVSPKIGKYLNSIHESVQESSELTQKLLAFGRRQVMDLKTISLNNLISAHLQDFKTFLEDNIKIKENLDPHLAHIKVDPVQMGQVVLNLILNARDALPKGGEITIETRNIEIGERLGEEEIEAPAGKYVKLSISDNGVGIKKEILDKIFDPFFTTKERGKGTGLGLSSVHGIVKQSHGQVNIESEIESGTKVHVYFPATQKGKVENSQNNKLANDYDSGSEFVLVIEDNKSLGEGCCEVLEAAGYKTWLADHPHKALDYFLENKDQIDLVLTDLIMPQLKGDELIKKFMQHKPDLKVIYTSGYTEETIQRDSPLKKDFILIQKPVARKTLLSTVRAVLDAQVRKGLY